METILMEPVNKQLLPHRWSVGLFIGFAVLLMVEGGVLVTKQMSQAQVSEQRLEEVNQRGAQVMPFDLNRTTHIFATDTNGGTQMVTANDPSDSNQVELIQAHLQEEARKFSNGDFSDPATIHGAEMPGLTELQRGANRINVQYESLPNGARLRYSSNDSTLVAALHRWLGAQNTDHNGHHGEMSH